MGLYQKVLVLAAILGLIGIPVLIIDFSDLSWQNNTESYWGMIAMAALLISVYIYRRAEKLEEKYKNKL